MPSNKQSNGGPTPPSERSCLEQWESNLRATKNELAIKTAEVQKYSWIKANASMWLAKLRTYKHNIEQTKSLADDMLGHIKSLVDQLERVCGSTNCSVTALEAVFCLLQDFFRCTDDFNVMLSSLRNKIKCLNDPNLNANSSIILKCLDEMAEKLDKSIAAQKDMLKLAITLMQQAYTLKRAICDTADDCSFQGLVAKFNQLFDNPEGALPGHMPAGGGEYPGASCADGLRSLKPIPKLPLIEEDYYCQTIDQFSAAEQELAEINTALTDARGELEGLQSCKKSLEDAIEASKKAKNCR